MSKGPPDGPIRVVLVDDHALVREGLKLLLDAQPDMQVVGEAADGEGACRAAREIHPDVLIIDLSMPVLNGSEATERIRRDCPDVKVIVLSVHEEEPYITRLLRAGASGYVLKRSASAGLVDAVRAVASGEKYIDPPVANTLVEGYLAPASSVSAKASDTLSPRERDVILRIARGYSNKEIAGDLNLSVKTVETYKARVSEKLGLHSRVDIVRFAAEQGWLAAAAAD